MTGRDEQRERFREALDRKEEAAREASHSVPTHGSEPGDPPALAMRDARDARAKNSGRGKKTADNWNQ
jgi:hypothetical protein